MNISNNKRYIETEERIHLAFEKLLSVKSFNEITVNSICNEAGISRPSFYAHYEDINDMMNQIELSLSSKVCKLILFFYGGQKLTSIFTLVEWQFFAIAISFI